MASSVTHLCRLIPATLVTLLFLLPLFILFILPLFTLWRLSAKILSKLCCRNHAKMLHSIGNLMAVEYPEMFQQRSNGDLCVAGVLDGYLDHKDFCEHFYEKFVLAKLPHTNQYENPELRQTVTSFMGFLFWKWDPNFCVEKHVKLYNGGGSSSTTTHHNELNRNSMKNNNHSDHHVLFEEELAKVLHEFSTKPFVKDQSPWEILVWPNVRLANDPEQRIKSLIFYRTHHCLADGFSILKLVIGQEVLRKTVPEFLNSGDRSGNFCLKFFKHLCLGIAFPFQLILIIIQSLAMACDYSKDDEEATGEGFPDSGNLSGKLHFAISSPIPLAEIKAIRKQMKCSFHTVTLAALAGGFRKLLMAGGNHKLGHPTMLPCFIPLPVPNHPIKLRNHMTALTTAIPINIKDPHERIRAIEEICLSLRKSTVPMTTFILSRLMGSLPHWAVKVARQTGAICVMSNFSGPRETVFINGLPVDTVHFGGGLFRKFGCAVSCLSYNENLRIGFSADETILPDPSFVQNMVQYMLEEIQILQGLDIVQV